MWFKNLILYRLTRPFEWTPEALEAALAERPFQPLPKLQVQTQGWSEPLGQEGGPRVHAVGGYLLLRARREEKILPPAAIRDRLEARLAEIEKQENRRVRGKEKQRLRDQVIFEMLPQAFSKCSDQYAYIDPANGWLVVDAASQSKAEAFVELLRETLGSLPLVPLAVDGDPAAQMTHWLRTQRLPTGFEVGQECELKAPEEAGGVVRIRNESLFSDEVQAHLDAGKRVTRLALGFDERLSFLLDDQLRLKRLRFENQVLDEAADTTAETAAERLDADFSLMTLELARLLPALGDALGGLSDSASENL